MALHSASATKAKSMQMPDFSSMQIFAKINAYLEIYRAHKGLGMQLG